jgi:hypothetical protein
MDVWNSCDHRHRRVSLFVGYSLLREGFLSELRRSAMRKPGTAVPGWNQAQNRVPRGTAPWHINIRISSFIACSALRIAKI